MSAELLVIAVVMALGVSLRTQTRARSIRRRLRSQPLPRVGYIPATRSSNVIAARRSRRRRSRTDTPATDRALAGLLDDLARRCASGESLSSALIATSRIRDLSPIFDDAISALHRGATVAEAMQQQRASNSSVTLVVHVIVLCSRVGGNASESLDRAAATLRERDAANSERLAHSAQARLSARVLTMVPVFFGSWTVLSNAHVRRFVVTPVGTVCVGVGLALNIVGSRAMNRIIEGVR
jgi:tight adherence protein B